MTPEAARRLAERVHARALDRYGAPLLEHIRGVVVLTPPDARSVAWLHEIFESSSLSAADLREAGATDEEIEAIRLLTRAPSTDPAAYDAHVRRIADAPGPAGELARVVKRADLRDRLRRQRAAPRRGRPARRIAGRSPCSAPLSAEPRALARRYARPGMAKPAKKKVAPGDVASNRQARHRFELLDKLECGMVLQGTEVKALRESGATLKDAYAQIRSGELWLYNAHIPPYGPGCAGEPRARAAAQAARAPARDRAAHRQAAAPGPDARPDADLLQGAQREDRDRARQGQGPLRQAPVDQGARDQARHGPRAARGQPLGDLLAALGEHRLGRGLRPPRSSPRTSSRPRSQKPGSARSSPAIAARSSGLREPPAASISR